MGPHWTKVLPVSVPRILSATCDCKQQTRTSDARVPENVRNTNMAYTIAPISARTHPNRPRPSAGSTGLARTCIRRATSNHRTATARHSSHKHTNSARAPKCERMVNIMRTIARISARIHPRRPGLCAGSKGLARESEMDVLIAPVDTGRHR
jgi:hypothetical protein